MTASLAAPLVASPALLFEPAASLELQCDDPGSALATIDGAALAAGGNRLLVGEEIVQFLEAHALGGGRWRLAGLLRGRGATEAAALAGHASGVRACLLDDRLHLLDGALVDAATERLAAMSIADTAPAYTTVRAPGRSRRPLAPVHGRAVPAADGGLWLEWTRRARGAWAWRDGADVPLVEEAERYEVGAGAVENPLAVWPTTAPAMTLTAGELAALPAGTTLWVRQVGSHARSPAHAVHVIP